MKEVFNCLTCDWMEWISEIHGSCSYPIPTSVEKSEVRLGVWTTGKADYTKVGIKHQDGSLVEVKNCSTWRGNEFRLRSSFV